MKCEYFQACDEGINIFQGEHQDLPAYQLYKSIASKIRDILKISPQMEIE